MKTSGRVAIASAAIVSTLAGTVHGAIVSPKQELAVSVTGSTNTVIDFENNVYEPKSFDRSDSLVADGAGSRTLSVEGRIDTVGFFVDTFASANATLRTAVAPDRIEMRSATFAQAVGSPFDLYEAEAVSTFKVSFSVDASQPFLLTFDSDRPSDGRISDDDSLLDFVLRNASGAVIWDQTAQLVDPDQSLYTFDFTQRLNLEAGDYVIEAEAGIFGGIEGLPSGGQSFNNFALAPVPEPSTWALLVAGLIASGLSARRSHRSSGTVA